MARYDFWRTSNNYWNNWGNSGSSSDASGNINDMLDDMADPDQDDAPVVDGPTPNPNPSQAAADIFVDVRGADSNSGSASAPVASISRAVALASAGDVISVSGGTYTKTVNIHKAGITIRAEAGEEVIIDGSGTAANSDLVSITASNVTFDGFEVRDAKRSGISVWNAHDVTISDNEVHNSARNGIWVGGSREGVSYGNVVRDNVVHDNVQENAATNTGSGWARGIAIDISTDSLVEDNFVFKNYGEGVGGLSSTDLTYTGNTIYDNFSVQLYFDNSQDITATDNLIFQTGDTEFYRNGKAGIGVLIANEYAEVQKASSGYEVTGNTLAGVGSPSYDGSYGWGGGITNSNLGSNTILSASAVEADWLYA